MYILIVEDDKLQYQYFREALLENRTLDTPRIERVTTEKEFRDRFEEISTDRPDIILMDIMLRWADPAPNLPEPPDEVKKVGFYRAGLRCERMLASDERTSSIPVILYSVLEYEDLREELPNRPEVKLLDKDFDKWELGKAVREAAR